MESASRSNWWPELEPVRQAAADGRLTLGRCTACQKHHYYPRLVCPFCLAPARFDAADGEGVIYSLSVVRRGAEAPSAVAYVSLVEGVTILARIDGCDFDAVRIGDPVRLLSVGGNGESLAPVFSPRSRDKS